MWDHRYLSRMDFRMIPIIIGLMLISLLVISSTTGVEGQFISPFVKSQMSWFLIGWGAYLFFACFDYRKLREWAWILYLIMILLLLGLFFTAPIHRVHRWYRIPILHMMIQPSEYAKLTVVLSLSWFLERRANAIKSWRVMFQACLIVLIPFALILKQPDLGSALVLFPVLLVMFYFGGVRKEVIRIFSGITAGAVLFIVLIFLGLIPHEALRPYATTVLKDYQYERLNPNTYHQKAAQTAVALGHIRGSGWKNSEFTGEGWLPYAHTDSVFPAFAEEFGIMGAFFLLLFFFGLLYFSFQVTAVAKDRFGRLLSAGITVYLAIHIIVNMGMMCGYLPITGVPLILVTYGGSSILAVMTALGILQSIYTRRFMF